MTTASEIVTPKTLMHGKVTGNTKNLPYLVLCAEAPMHTHSTLCAQGKGWQWALAHQFSSCGRLTNWLPSPTATTASGLGHDSVEFFFYFLSILLSSLDYTLCSPFPNILTKLRHHKGSKVQKSPPTGSMCSQPLPTKAMWLPLQKLSGAPHLCPEL